MIIAAHQTMLAPQGGPSSLDYVQDAAILFFDGIENAGRGTHSSSSLTWKNLAGGPDGVAASFAGGHWDNAGFFFNNDGYFDISLSSVAWPTGGITVEIAYSLPSAGTWAGRVIGSKQTNSANTRIMWQTNSSGSYGAVLAWGRDYPDNIVLGGAGFPRALSVAIIGSTANSSHRVRWNGSDQTIYNMGTNYPQKKPTLIAIGNEGDHARPLYGTVHAFRFHSRQLTDAEIDANAALDRERFNVT